MPLARSQGADAVVVALLGILLDAHPAHLRVDELVRLLAVNGDKTARCDDTLVAVADLVSHGLAHRHGDFVFASLAATRFNELDGPTVPQA